MNTSCSQLLAPSSIGAAERWIQYAVRQGVKSFDLELYLREEDDSKKQKERGKERLVMALDELPSSAKLETLALDLSNARVRLPATVVFPSLVDLTLQSMEVAGDSSHLFAGLLSSPRLKKLRMHKVKLTGLHDILIQVGTLLELSLGSMSEMRSLELRTPNLRVFCIETCFKLEALTVLAPRLEDLKFWYNPYLIHIEGELHCSRLLELNLSSHSHRNNDDNNGSIRLLQHCSSIRVLTLYLLIKRNMVYCIDIIKGRLPPLPHVTSLAIDVHLLWEQHSLGDNLASLLTGFNNLRNLEIQLYNAYIDNNV
ncbi:hypothetical protein EJB05_03832, partial [Eragrostis curvula]